MTLHNANIIADLHCVTLLPVTRVHYILYNTSFTLISFYKMKAYYFYREIFKFHPCNYKLQILPP